MRAELATAGDDRSLWAGIPVPIEGIELRVEPTYPHAALLEEITRGKAEEGEAVIVRNEWYSKRRRQKVVVYERAAGGGRVEHVLMGPHPFDLAMSALFAADAWGLEQEARAVRLLATMIPPRHLRQYLLTGMFLATSARSGVTYALRRLRPTVAMRMDRSDGKMRCLCCLCMHPIAYYAESFAGAMVPTDDVVAHLTLMRADERRYWARCSQHHPATPQAGMTA